MRKKTKIYIAGRITGEADYEAKFAEAETAYQEAGCIVLNPAKLPGGMDAADYMRICFAMIDTADAVAFLPGSENSAGARLELAYCEYIKKPHTLQRM